MGKNTRKMEGNKEKVIHPLSRKAKQLSKKVTRDAKMLDKKSSTNMRLQLIGNKLMWFKQNFDSTIKFYTIEQLHDLIERYINRNEEEFEQINMKNNIGHRKSRQHASREDLLRICKETEMEEFKNSGFETIDLTNEANLNDFKIWNGQLSLLSNLKLRKFVKGSIDPQNNENSNEEEMAVE